MKKRMHAWLVHRQRSVQPETHQCSSHSTSERSVAQQDPCNIMHHSVQSVQLALCSEALEEHAK